MRPCVARPDGSLEVLGGLRPAGQSGSVIQSLDAAEMVPLPDGAALMHLPGRTALTLDSRGRPFAAEGFLPVAAVLPVGYVRTLLPAAREETGRQRLPLFGYAAVAERRGRLMVAAAASDDFAWWRPSLRAPRGDLESALAAARQALPGNRLVDHLAVCALQNRCYTAQNTLLRQYEGALPASPACNADCLGCISLQSDGEAPAPQPRMRFAPTAEELAGLASYHLAGEGAAIVSFGQGCEGEPLTRDDALVNATAEIRRRHPAATIHINTNGSKPRMLERLIEAGCDSVRISAISFTDSVFRAYYRPAGYGLDDVIACGRVMAASGGQVCLNLLTFPGLTDAPKEIERTAAACRDMRVQQVQWRSLNVDPGWLIAVLERGGHDLGRGIGVRAAMEELRRRLPGVEHGNFTRPVTKPVARPAQA
ncbi:MAG: radical SAM protein [Candidatus Dormibacteraeota bacterium]|nr:radical SAM protein [Candidatus Dormibacteraeota bacterium]MBV9525296.1 radical SAM protein [Candidatus Dormibacteraeota bacterium]